MARSSRWTVPLLVALLVLSGALLLLRHEEQRDRSVTTRLERDLAVCNELLAAEQRRLTAAARLQAERARGEVRPGARLDTERFDRMVAELTIDGVDRVQILDPTATLAASHDSSQGHRMRARLMASARDGFAASAMLPFPSGFRLEAAVPILDEAGAPAAILAVGRPVDRGLLDKLEQATGCLVIPAPTEDLLAPVELVTAETAPPGRLKEVAARADAVIRARVPARDSQVLFQQLRDPSGKPAGVLALALPDSEATIRGNRWLVGGWLVLGLVSVFALTRAQAPTSALANGEASGWLPLDSNAVTVDPDSLNRCAESLNHHLNNTFAVVIGNLEILRERHGGGDRVMEDVIAYSWQASQMLKRFQKACGRRLVPRLREVPLTDAVAQAVSAVELRQGGRRRIEAEGLDGLALAGRESDLVELLVELLDNAWQATAPDGRITITAGRRGQRVRLEMRDDGPGMSEAVARQAAEPFYTTRGPRTAGLGLAVVDSVVHRHGGRWGIRSRPGDGCTVWVELPAF